MSVTETAARLRDEAEDLRDRLEPAVDRVRAAAPDYADRGREYAERGLEALEQARDAAPDYADRVVEQGRDAADWVTDRLGDLDIDFDLDDEKVRTWGPRLLAAAIGFVVGLLVGRRLSGRRERDEDEGDRGLAQAPRQTGAKPPTRMPEVADIVEVGSNGEQKGS